MKILCTGDTGFLGRAFIKRFGNEHDIVGIHHNYFAGNIPYKYHMVDICNGDIQRIIMREHPDIVCHFAAQTGILSSEWDIEHNLVSNINGLLNVLEGCKYAGHPRLIFPSSGGTVYGNKLNACESDPLNPCNPYGITKVAGEWYIRWYSERYNQPYNILRIGNLYGPGRSNNVISSFINRISKNEAITLYNSGTQEKDYIHIDDVLDLIEILLNNTTCSTLNVGTGIPTATIDLVTKLAHITGKTIDILHKDVPSIEVTQYSLNCDRVEFMHNWKYKTNLEEGLTKCLESV